MQKLARSIITIEKITQVTAIAGLIIFFGYLGLESLQTRNSTGENTSTITVPRSE